MSEVLIPMEGYNRYRAAPVGREHEDRYTKCYPHPMMDTLTSALAAKRPLWTYAFYGHGVQQYGGGYCVESVRIVENGLVLGAVRKEYSNRDHCYAIDNKRMSAERKRGYTTRTKDLKKAVKLILGNFYRPTPDELISAARDISETALRDLRMRVDHKHSSGVRGLLPDVVAFVFDHWDAFCARPVDVGKAKARDELPQSYAAKCEVGAIYNRWGDNSGVVVSLTDKAYHVFSPNLESRRDYAPDDVPTHIRSAIGMLKLLEPGGYIPDVGVRTDASTFFVSAQP